jgi:hypothetical protein
LYNLSITLEEMGDKQSGSSESQLLLLLLLLGALVAADQGKQATVSLFCFVYSGGNSATSVEPYDQKR